MRTKRVIIRGEKLVFMAFLFDTKRNFTVCKRNSDWKRLPVLENEQQDTFYYTVCKPCHTAHAKGMRFCAKKWYRTEFTCKRKPFSFTSGVCVCVCGVWFVYCMHVVRQDNNSINKMEIESKRDAMRWAWDEETLSEREIVCDGLPEKCYNTSVSCHAYLTAQCVSYTQNPQLSMQINTLWAYSI